jgi:hypothetical protein
LRRLLLLAPLALVAGCGLFSKVDTEKLERDIQLRLIAQDSTPSGTPGISQGSTAPAISVSCPKKVENKEGTRFQCSASSTRINTGPATPSTPGAPGLSTSAQTQRYEVDARVVDDSGSVRWTARLAD